VVDRSSLRTKLTVSHETFLGVLNVVLMKIIYTILKGYNNERRKIHSACYGMDIDDSVSTNQGGKDGYAAGVIFLYDEDDRWKR